MAGRITFGGGFMSLLKHSSLLRFIGLQPKPWLTIDPTGVTSCDLHISWNAFAEASPRTTYATFNSARTYDVLIQIKGDRQKVVIKSPGDLVAYLPLPRWQRIGGTKAAQFCLLTLLHYCFRFHCVRDCENSAGGLVDSDH